MSPSGTASDSRLIYPPAPLGDVVDAYHGHTVADPYRWLEDGDTPAVRAWIDAEVELTERFLSAVPARDALRARITALWNYERFGVPRRAGDVYVYSKNSGLQNQSVVYVAPEIAGPARVLLDPNTFSADGTVALGGLSFSDDGAYVAYSTSASGSDWMTWRVRDVATGEDLPDVVEWSKFSGASWMLDGSGFFYSRYAEPDASTQFKTENYNQLLFFHKLGTAQADDTLIYERPDHPDWNLSGYVTEDGRWLVISASQGTDPNNRLFVRDLHAPESAIVDLLVEGDAAYDVIGNTDDTFFLRTTKDAPRGRVVSLRVGALALTEVVPESDPLESASLFGEQLVLEYLHDAHAVVRRFGLDGAPLGEVALPGLGTASGFAGKQTDTETFYAYTSYTTPTSIYRLDLTTGASSLVFAPQVPFDPNAFESEQVFYHGNDGTRIPMIVARKKGMPRDGTTPDDPLRLRRLQHFAHARIFAGHACVARTRRCVRGCESARRRRVRRRVASRRHQRAQTKRVRRLHCGGRISHRRTVYLNAQTRDLRRQQRRPARGRVHDAAAGALRCGDPRGRRARYAALSEIHDRLGVDGRLWLVGRCRCLRVFVCVFAAA